MTARTRSRAFLCAIGGLPLACAVAFASSAGASNVRFSDFVPLPSSAGPTANEAMPITFGNPSFQQRSLADRLAQLAAGEPNSGNWDMITVNETGPHKGTFLFTPFETSQSGIQRHNLTTGETETIWYSPVPGGHVAFDASYWGYTAKISLKPTFAGVRRHPGALSGPYRPSNRADAPEGPPFRAAGKGE